MSELLIRGGTVVTMNGQLEVKRADVLVSGNAITKIGKGIRPKKNTCVLDAKGAAVIPGLIQCHVHLAQAIMRGSANGLPLLDWLKQRIWPMEAAHTPGTLRTSARLGLAEMLKAGTTCLLDMGTVHHHDAVFEAMKESGIRGFSGKAMMDDGLGVPKGLRESTKASLKESDRLADRWHGAADGRLSYAYAPRFILSCTEKLWREVAERSEATGLIVHSHIAEHKAERDAVKKLLGKDDVAALESFGVAGPRTVLAHGVQLRAGEMKRMAKLGTRIVHCPSANLQLASGFAPIRKMRDSGMVLGLGSDGAPCNNRMDPWTELRQCALLAMARELDANAIKPLEALAMATIEGAKVLGIDDQVGSIEVGKKADITVVDLDTLHAQPGGDVPSQLVYSATASDVKHVMVDGKLLVLDKELLSLDEEKVLRAAKRDIKKVLGRANLS